MEFYSLMGKVVVTLLVLWQFIYLIDIFVKKFLPLLKAAWGFAVPVVMRFKDQVLIQNWIKILKRWRARK